MSDTFNLVQRAESMDISPEFDGYSRVVIWLDTKDDKGNDMYVEAGTNTGRTLELTCPWGNQQMAEDVLERISPAQGRSFRYQPYSATNAILDPAAEIGDGVTLNGTYSGIFAQTENFGVRHLSDISAPTEEEVDHEYPYESATNRKIERKIAMEHAERKAELEITQRDINARVVKKYDSEEEAFGWRLDEKQFLVYGGNNVEHPVLKVTKDGLYVEGSGTFTGEIRATSGYIGNLENKTGFKITSTGKLFSNDKKTLDTPVDGVYIGQNGISLGKKGTGSAFKVDSAGNLYATSGTFEGTIYAGNIVYGTKNGVDRGYFNGEGLEDGSVSGGSGSGSKIKSGTISKGNCASSVTTPLEHGDKAWSGVKSAYIGNYRLNFGSGIVILGASFTDSMGGRCSGEASRSNVVTATEGGYNW